MSDSEKSRLSAPPGEPGGRSSSPPPIGGPVGEPTRVPGGLPPLKRLNSPPPSREDAKPHKNFGSTHRVKQILETYSMTAERSLMGPEAMDGVHSGGSGGYKLPPDVELSKTNLLKARDLSGAHHENDPKRHQVSVRQDLIHENKTDSLTSSMAAAKALAMTAVSERLQQNGLVTLSRIENPSRHNSDGAARREAYLSAMRHHSGVAMDLQERERHISAPLHDRARAKSDGCGIPDPAILNGNRQHLTGEMIRQIRQQQKFGPKDGPAAALFQQRVIQAAQQTATIAALQQHNLQMQAAYEKALKDKTYLRQSPQVPRLPPSPKNYSSNPDGFKAPPSQVAPLMTTRDPGHHVKLQETRLAGKDIACFYIGGEARCCLPQILNSILDQISLHAIHLSCDELQIYCSTCTHEQMEVLKTAKIIPISASQCGLITKSDAERLVSILLDRNPPSAQMVGFRAKSSPFSFRIQHFCFGECNGIVLPEAYTSPTAKCIECEECQGLFCPQKFVCHSHKPKNRTCHWGFDSANWRAYLHLSEEYTDDERDKLKKLIVDFKSRYSPTSLKRKLSSELLAVNGGSLRGHPAPPPPLHDDDKLIVDVTSDGDPPPSNQSKKPRLSAPDHHFQPGDSSNLPHPQLPGAPGGFDPYMMYMFQNWTKMNPGIHPAAAAALFAQALKEGKIPFPSGNGSSMPSDRRGSSLDRSPNRGHHHSGNGSYPGSSVPPLNSPARSLSGDRLQVSSGRQGSSRPIPTSSSTSKTSPLSSDGNSPPEKPGQELDPVKSEVLAGHRAIRRMKSSSTSSTSSTSLAEDIHSIRLALEGASTAVKERILKTLERLTARLALAESERDLALSELNDLQKRYRFIEDELHKKRAELREALRPPDNSSSYEERPINHYDPVAPPIERQGHSSSLGRSGVTLEVLSESSGRAQYCSEVEATDLRTKTSSEEGPPEPKQRRTFEDESQESDATPAKLKENESPVNEEKKEKRSLSEIKTNSQDFTEDYPMSPSGEVGSEDGSIKMPAILQRRLSAGTPASVKSRESEDLRDRMIVMEAELRALREELSNRGSSASSTASDDRRPIKAKRSASVTPTEDDQKNLDSNMNGGHHKPRMNGGGHSSGGTSEEDAEDLSGDDLLQPEKRLSIQSPVEEDDLVKDDPPQHEILKKESMVVENTDGNNEIEDGSKNP